MLGENIIHPSNSIKLEQATVVLSRVKNSERAFDILKDLTSMQRQSAKANAILRRSGKQQKENLMKHIDAALEEIQGVQPISGNNESEKRPVFLKKRPHGMTKKQWEEKE